MKAFWPFCNLYRLFTPHYYLIVLPLYSVFFFILSLLLFTCFLPFSNFCFLFLPKSYSHNYLALEPRYDLQ